MHMLKMGDLHILKFVTEPYHSPYLIPIKRLKLQVVPFVPVVSSDRHNLHIGIKFFIYPLNCCKIIITNLLSRWTLENSWYRSYMGSKRNSQIYLNKSKWVTDSINWGFLEFHNKMMIWAVSETHSLLLSSQVSDLFNLTVMNICWLSSNISNLL